LRKWQTLQKRDETALANWTVQCRPIICWPNGQHCANRFQL